MPQEKGVSSKKTRLPSLLEELSVQRQVQLERPEGREAGQEGLEQEQEEGVHSE